MRPLLPRAQVCNKSNPEWLAPHFQPLVRWLETEVGLEGVRSCEWQVDPANYAIVGAGAMLAGTVRLNLFVIMLLVEATGEPNYVLPISIGVMFAVWVGDRINHGIYHRLMDLASFPFLSNSPTIGQMYADVSQLLKILDQKVHTIPVRATVHEMRANLLSQHNAWPVVEVSEERDVPKGAGAGGQCKSVLKREPTSCIRLRATGYERGKPGCFIGMISRRELEKVLRVHITVMHLRKQGLGAPARKSTLLGAIRRSSIGLLGVDQVDENGPRTSTGDSRKSSFMSSVLTNRKGTVLSDVLQAGKTCARLSVNKIGGGNLVSEASKLADQGKANQLPQRFHGIARKLFSKLNHSDLVDLYDYMDGQPFVVRPQMGVFRVHKLFTLLGLRHVPVIDYGEKCVGIITRKDLLPHVLENFTQRAAEQVDEGLPPDPGGPPEPEGADEEEEGAELREFSYRCSVGPPNPAGQIRV